MTIVVTYPGEGRVFEALGMEVVASEFVPHGRAYLLAPARSAFGYEPPSFEWRSSVQDALRLEARLALSVRRTVRETNPLYWPPPRGFRATLRRTRQIVGYSVREAKGRPLYHADPRDFALVTGLTA